MQATESPAPLAGGKPGSIRNHSARESIAQASGVPRLPVGSRYCLCSGCGRYFGGTDGFDRHRGGGACADPSNLGMSLDAAGYWRRAAPNMAVVPGGVAKADDFGRSSGIGVQVAKERCL